MENVDLSVLQKLVQESIQRANLAILASDTLAKLVPPRLGALEGRMNALEGRMNALEQRISSVEDSQHEIIRLLVGQDAANQRIEATLGQIAARLPPPARS